MNWFQRAWVRLVRKFCYRQFGDKVLYKTGIPAFGYLRNSRGQWWSCVCSTNGSPGWLDEFNPREAYLEGCDHAIRLIRAFGLAGEKVEFISYVEANRGQRFMEMNLRGCKYPILYKREK